MGGVSHSCITLSVSETQLGNSSGSGSGVLGVHERFEVGREG